MRLLGDLVLFGQGQIKSARIENLAEDPVSPMAGQLWYNTDDGVYRGYDGTTVITFASGTLLASLQAELDATQLGAGLQGDGSYLPTDGTNYINTATSLNDADLKLDAALKALSDEVDTLGGGGGSIGAVQDEVDAIETAVGLNGDGTFTAPTGTSYLDGISSVKSGLVALDGAAHTNAQNIDSVNNALIGINTDIAAKLDKAGGTMSGNIAMGNNKITGLAAPTDATDGANKGYVDNALSGLDFQPDVLDVQTDNTLVPTTNEGDRYLITDAANLNAGFGSITGVENGDIVQYENGAFVIAYDVSDAGPGAITWVRDEGTFYYFNTSWAPFGGLDGVSAGIGLQKTGNVLSVQLGAGVGQLPTNEVGLDLFANSGLILTVDGTTASTDAAAQLALLLDGGTLQTSAAGLKVKNAGIGAAQLAAAAFGNGLQGGAGTAITVKPKAAGGIVVDADGVSIDPSSLEFLPLSGGTLTGDLFLAGDPTSPSGATNKAYVDTKVQGVTAAVEGGDFVYDGSVSAVTHTVIHNIGSKYVNVTVVDSSDKVIIPDSITFDSANQLTVTFASAITCKVVVSGKYVAA